MNDLLFYLWGPGMMLLVGAIVYFVARNDRAPDRRHRPK
jgi:hypothetical protein